MAGTIRTIISTVFGRCSYDSYHSYLNTSYAVVYESVIPELAPYPEKVNCTLFGHYWYDSYRRYSSLQGLLNFWGTDEGLFVRQFGCSGVISEVIDGQVINDLEEVYALTPIYKQNYVLAATNTGVQYTEASVFRETDATQELLVNVEKVAFKQLASFPVEKVYSICTDSKLYNALNIEDIPYVSLCEKVIWVASESGVRKLYASLKQEYFDQLSFGAFSYSKNPTSSTASSVYFKKCQAENLTVDLRYPQEFSNQVLVQWFKDGIEQTSMIGKLKAELVQEGKYKVKITALCEGISVNSKEIIIENTPAATAVLNYPAEINLCKGSTYTLSTLATQGYMYRWYKNGQLIPGANSADYTVSQTGVYHIEVSNCSGIYVASNPVALNFLSVDQPTISSSKQVYCKDEQASLSVNLASGQQTNWYLNGQELESMRNLQEILVNEGGTYTVKISNAFNCWQMSAPYVISFPSLPDLKIMTNSSFLCNGESLSLSADINASSYKWSTGEASRDITVKEGGTYQLVATLQNGCSVSTSIEITEFDKPELLQPADEQICTISGQQLILKAEPGFKSYTWNGIMGQGNSFIVTKPGIYTLKVEDANGCSANVKYNVKPWCKDIIIPNVFTPNADGINDSWIISGLENEPDAKISVYNRLGKLVYQAKGCCVNWNGSMMHEYQLLPDGTYFYVISFTSRKDILNGSVAIVR